MLIIWTSIPEVEIKVPFLSVLTSWYGQLSIAVAFRILPFRFMAFILGCSTSGFLRVSSWHPDFFNRQIPISSNLDFQKI